MRARLVCVAPLWTCPQAEGAARTHYIRCLPLRGHGADCVLLGQCPPGRRRGIMFLIIGTYCHSASRDQPLGQSNSRKCS